jgi:hypothetical protein
MYENDSTAILVPLAVGFPRNAIAAIWVCPVQHPDLALTDDLVRTWRTVEKRLDRDSRRAQVCG